MYKRQLQLTPKTFITSSPRWLITFTAMRPVLGLSKGRDRSLFSVPLLVRSAGHGGLAYALNRCSLCHCSIAALGLSESLSGKVARVLP